MSLNIFLSAILILFTFAFIVLIYFAWNKRESPLAISYGLGVVIASFYTFGYAFQLVSTTIDQMMFWIRIQYIGIPFAPFIFLIIVFQFTGKHKLITKRNIALLLIGPLSTLITHYTNEWHYLFYKSMSLDYSQGFPLIVLDRGPFFYLHICIVYSYYVVGLCLLIHMYFNSTRERKKQVILMLIGTFCVFGFPFIHSIGLVSIPIDISPFGLIISGLFYLWGINHFNMLNLSPLAMKKVFESIHDAVIVFNKDDTINSFNHSARSFFESFPENKISGSPASKVLSHLPSLLQLVEKTSINESSTPISLQLGEKYYYVRLSLINGQNNKQIGKILILHEVTASIQYEASLLRQSQQLAELNLFKDKMFKVVAHDIREPLAILVNLMELINMNLPKDELKGINKEIVEEMNKQINNTFLLIESLLAWFQAQSGGMIFNPVVRDLGNVVRTIINMMQVKINSKQINIDVAISENVYVYADKDMLDLIIRNLLSNAVKFSNIGGSIKLSSEISQNKVIIAICDTGQGIAEDEVNNLFQNDLHISKKGTAGEQGLGLGLSICREFVHLNGGEIWFDSSVGVGTTFYFTLPIASKISGYHTDTKEVIV